MIVDFYKGDGKIHPGIESHEPPKPLTFTEARKANLKWLVAKITESRLNKLITACSVLICLVTILVIVSLVSESSAEYQARQA